MNKPENRAIVHRLILAREFGRQGYRWNRAFRRELWKRLKRRNHLGTTHEAANE